MAILREVDKGKTVKVQIPGKGEITGVVNDRCSGTHKKNEDDKTVHVPSDNIWVLEGSNPYPVHKDTSVQVL
ncbi:MAG: hypothetical protein ABID45_02085 [Patescibacteria group bacterium]